MKNTHWALIFVHDPNITMIMYVEGVIWMAIACELLLTDLRHTGLGRMKA
jgi:hypothetical protein